jgi:RNA polymerase sigma factor (sigma-70 family)
MYKTRLSWRASHGLWPDDADLGPLVRRAQQGDPGAVNALLERVRPVLIEFFAHEVDHDTADDLTQEALLRVFKALPKLDPDRASRYLTRLAHYRLRSAYAQRAQETERFAPLAAARDVEAPGTSDRAAEHDDVVRLVQRITAVPLSPKLRDCVLGLLNGSSLKELAAAQGVKPVTMRARLRLARRRLRGLAAEARQTLKEAGLAGLRRVREAGVAPYHSPVNAFSNCRVGGSGGVTSRGASGTTPLGAVSTSLGTRD